MNTRPAPSDSRSLARLPFALGGCAVLVLCVLCACAANAAYWTLRGPAGVNRRAARPNQPISAAPGSPAAGSADSGGLPGTGNPTRGEQVFQTAGGCPACHALDPGSGGIGPSLAGLAERAASRVPDQTAEAYILTAITDPAAFVVDGYPSGLMPEGYGKRLTGQQLADLTGYLLTR